MAPKKRAAKKQPADTPGAYVPTEGDHIRTANHQQRLKLREREAELEELSKTFAETRAQIREAERNLRAMQERRLDLMDEISKLAHELDCGDTEDQGDQSGSFEEEHVSNEEHHGETKEGE